MTAYNLIPRIIDLSESNTWDSAVKEWDVEYIEFEDDAVVDCLCGHRNIKELCHIHNRNNDARTIVGNCCVQKFMNLPSSKMFAAVKRVAKDLTKSLNSEVLELALGNKWITTKDCWFYMDILSKRKLSTKQMRWKRSINVKVAKACRCKIKENE